jgi:sulfite exporter TauE/SafE
MYTQLIEGFTLGLATGTACLATCGPVYAPYLMQYDRNIKSSILALLEISAGRFVTYFLFGLISGYIGISISEVNRSIFTGSAYILFSIFLLLSVRNTLRHEKKCAYSKWSKFTGRPIVLGILTGINFCPSFLIALTKSVSMSGPMSGALFFTAFFAGTTIFLLPVSFFGFLGRQQLMRRIARVSAIAIGVWFIGSGLHTFYEMYQEHYKIKHDSRPIVNVMDALPAYVIGTDSIVVHTLKDSLSVHRPGRVLIASCKEDFADSTYFILVPDSLGRYVCTKESLRKKNRFVFALPAAPLGVRTEDRINAIVGFFKEFHFRMDPDSGTVYSIPAAFIPQPLDSAHQITL